MLFLLLEYALDVDIVNCRVNFTLYEFASVVLFDVAVPLFPGHCYFLRESLLSEKPQSHVITISQHVFYIFGLQMRYSNHYFYILAC